MIPRKSIFCLGCKAIIELSSDICPSCGAFNKYGKRKAPDWRFDYTIPTAATLERFHRLMADPGVAHTVQPHLMGFAELHRAAIPHEQMELLREALLMHNLVMCRSHVKPAPGLSGLDVNRLRSEALKRLGSPLEE